MKKKIISTFVLLFIMCLTINVKAGDDWYSVYTDIEKGEDSRQLYNSMPTEITKGSIISVNVILNRAAGWKVHYGNVVLEWDKEAFEIVETNGKYYADANADLESASTTFQGNNRVNVSYNFEGASITSERVKILQLKFKVKKDVKDGVYYIKLEEGDGNNVFYDEDHGYEPFHAERYLQYQVGDPKLTSSYTENEFDELEGGSYIIGSHLFTRSGSTEYSGTLTTEYIMLASKTIESNNKNDMIVYGKSAYGEWKNAITDEAIEMPDEIKIDYVNMMANYSENGIYSNDGDNTILRLVQINDNEAIITIENYNERIHGIATISNRVATLRVGSKNYTINISDNSVTINTSDTYITNSNSLSLQKKAKMSINTYYDYAYNGAGFYYVGVDAPSMYVNSLHNGRYTLEDYELYLLRIGSDSGKICLREKGQTECLIDENLYSNEMGYYGNEKTNYAFEIEDTAYGINWNTTGIQVKCLEGTCNNAYLGTYEKENALSMDDTFHIWEKNTVQYAVVFDADNGEDDPYIEYITSGDIIDPDMEAYKDDHVFVEWRLNGESFDPQTPITAPMTLVASYKKLPGEPTLTTVPNIASEPNYYNFEDDTFYYHFTIASDDEYDGFAIFDTMGYDEPVVTAPYGEYADISLELNAQKTYYARSYVDARGIRHYSDNSNFLSLNAVKYTVTFVTDGGTQIEPAEVPYKSTVVAPNPNPQKAHYVFQYWAIYNEELDEYQEFDFNTRINSDMTIKAMWELDFGAPVLGDLTGPAIYNHALYLSNHNAYCTNHSTECTMSVTDNYKITGYKLYEVNPSTSELTLVEIENKSEFAPYETVSVIVEPNQSKRYVAVAFVQDGAERLESDRSSEFVISSNIPTPSIAFNPEIGEAPDGLSGTYDVTNWVEVTNLDTAYTSDSTGYIVDGFEVYTDTTSTDSGVSFGAGDAVHVGANYGDNVTYYVRARVTDSTGNHEFYSAYSNPLVLDTTEPESACYIDGDDAHHWSNNPNPSWLLVDGVTSQSACEALDPAPACYYDGAELYHWTRYPESYWTLVPELTTEENCNRPYVCYVDGDDLHHWSNYPELNWTEVDGIESQAACEALDSD